MITRTISLYKNAYGGLSKSTWWLALVMLINRSGTMVIPFMTMYLTQHMGTSISQAGFVMSMFGSGAVAGALIGGKLADKFGAYYIQIFTLCGGGIMFIILGQMHSYPAICITTFVLAFINEAFRPANSVAVALYSDVSNRTRSFSLNRLAINLGWAFGGALGGILASHDYSLLFWVDGCSNIGAAILLYLVLAPSRNVASIKKPSDKSAIKKSVYKDSNYLFFIFGVFLFALCFFQLFTTLPVFYRVQFHLSLVFIGMLMAINGLIISLFEMVIIFKLEGRRPHLHFISFGVVLIGLSYAFLIINNLGISVELIALISIMTITLGEILSMPFMNSYWISRTQENNRGQYASLYTVGWASAQAIGPFLGALVAQHFGYNTLWIVIFLICLFLRQLYLWLHKRKDALKKA